MAKKLTFVIMVFLLMIAASVVSMAIDDDFAAVKNVSAEKTGNWMNSNVIDYSDIDANAMDNIDEAIISQEYSHEYVIQEYESSLFDKSNQFEGVYMEHIDILKQNTSADDRDYVLTATLKDEVELDGDAVVIMVFVEKDGTYELLREPAEINNKMFGGYLLTMPYTGNDKPNHIRVVAFLKNSYQVLEPGVNVEIVDQVIEVRGKDNDIKSTLLSRDQTYNNVKKKIGIN